MPGADALAQEDDGKDRHPHHQRLVDESPARGRHPGEPLEEEKEGDAPTDDGHQGHCPRVPPQPGEQGLSGRATASDDGEGEEDHRRARVLQGRVGGRVGYLGPRPDSVPVDEDRDAAHRRRDQGQDDPPAAYPGIQMIAVHAGQAIRSLGGQ